MSPQAPHGEPFPFLVCGDPESGTDHSLKEVSACHSTGHSTGASRVAVTRMSVLSLIYFSKFYISFTIDKHVSIQDSSNEGTCVWSKKAKFQRFPSNDSSPLL